MPHTLAQIGHYVPMKQHANADLAADALNLLVDLIRIDTSNPGDNSGVGEIEAARYVQAALSEVGLASELFTTTAAHRAGVGLLLPGTDREAEVLLLTGHLDVVPADASQWQHPPFGAEIDNGYLYGRGAVDMKNMVAMILAVVRHWARTGFQPRRPIAVLFTPDEEAGGEHGAHWIVENRPDLLHAATEAIGEVGGFSVTLPNGRRLFPIQTGEKGLAWVTALVPGTAGHGSLIHTDNPIVHLVTALNELLAHPFMAELTDTMAIFAAEIEDLIGEPLALNDPNQLADQLGNFARVVGASVRNTINPTMLGAGVKHNIVPNTASVGLDIRFLPGQQEQALDLLNDTLPAGSTVSFANLDIAVETSFDGPIIDTIKQVLGERDPQARVVPYLMTGGTDGKAFSTLGVRYFGFSPLLLPAEEDFWAIFHGIDERIPVAAIEFGVEVLDEVLRGL